MPGFNYVYMDKNGRQKKGQMDASDEGEVLQVIRSEGNIPVSVEKQNVFNKPASGISLGKKVTLRDISVFCRQIVSIVSSGVPIVDALFMLSEQTENPKLQEAIRETQTMVEKGETLAGAMAQFPKIFPSILVNLVEAGEATGSLENSFSRMAVHFEKTAKTRALVRKALIYPIMICVVAIAVIVIMMIFVIPNFIKMFEEMDSEIPASTQTLVNMSKFMTENWYWILAGIAILVFVLRWFRTTPQGKVFFSKVAIQLPIFGKFNRKSASANFSRTLSTLVSSGIPMVVAIEITSKTMKNEIYRQALLHAKEEVERGVALSQELEKAKIFPPMVYHMTRIGEETGNLEEMLIKVADYYEEEVEVGAQSLTTVIEPIILVVMAVIVAIMILSLLDPMLSMFGSVEGSGI